MTIRYENTRWDIFRLQCHGLGRNKILGCFLGLAAAFVCYSRFTDPAFSSDPVTVRAIASILTTCVLLALGTLPGLIFIALIVLAGMGKGVVGEHRLSITDEGLEEGTPYGRTIQFWNGLEGLRETRGYFFIFVTKYSAHVIPKKRPLLDGDLSEFISAAKARLHASR